METEKRENGNVFFFCSRKSQFALNNTICAPRINESRSRISRSVCSRSLRLFAVKVTRSSCKNK